MRVNETPETKRKAELFQCYQRGWQHGVRAVADDPRFTNHDRRAIRDAYMRGHLDGREARNAAHTREAKRIGYDPTMSILRADPSGSVSK